ncbi:MAG: Gfo/Idh/MocA family oxidoreductase [Phycisphaerales bacterium]|nr:Gfo/Idh/MocA family oxidoreductase [Phycisphaerales bacterium]
MSDLRWAVMGTGRIAAGVRRHIDAAAGCRVVCAASRDGVRARAFASEHGLEDACTYDELCGRAGIDAVYVTVPNHLHTAWSCRLMEAGHHVLCEKPLTPRRADAERVAATSRASGRVFQEGFMYMHHPQTRRLIELAQMGEMAGSVIGRLRFIRGFHCVDLRVPHAWTRFSHAMEGGAIMDIGCYPFGFARLLTGEEPEEIGAVARWAPPLEGETASVDGEAAVSMRFPSGVIFAGGCSMESASGVYLKMTGTWGSVWTGWPYGPDPERAVLHLERTSKHPEGAWEGEEIIAHGGERFANQFGHFARAVRGEADPVPSLAWTIGQATMIERIHTAIGLHFAPPEA